MTKHNPSHPALSIPRLIAHYYALSPDPQQPREQVSFGTSGHRGTSDTATFNEAHILAITQAIVDYRTSREIFGPLFLAADTHALSEPAFFTALEVLVANNVYVNIHPGPVPTPVLSFAVRQHNQNAGRCADGIVITPSHNPPTDGGLKYNPPHGGPAETAVTAWIQTRANAHLADNNVMVKRVPLRTAQESEYVRTTDMIDPYVRALADAIDFEAIQRSDVSIGVDPLGGAALETWDRIAEHYSFDLTIVQRTIDPTFAFMPLDHDGLVRMDCSSQHSMAGLLAHRNSFSLAVGNDPDADRHGIVTPAGGLLHPNHFYAVVLDFLIKHRKWTHKWSLGRTVVTSMMLDRIANEHGIGVIEVPVGFKWFVPGLAERVLGLAVEESAGASLLTREGKPWTTDKDGIVMGLLAAEITAVGGDISDQYDVLAEKYGGSYPLRKDIPSTPQIQAALIGANPESVRVEQVAGSPITRVTNTASGESIGGIKVETRDGWFAARPSGTEPLYKIYAESLRSAEHAEELLRAGEQFVSSLLGVRNG